MAEQKHGDHEETSVPARRKSRLETCWTFNINRVISTHRSHDISRTFHYKAIALTNLGVIHPSDDEDDLQRAQECVFLDRYNAYCCKLLLGSDRAHWHSFVVVRFPYPGDTLPAQEYFQYRGFITDMEGNGGCSCEELFNEFGGPKFCETGDLTLLTHNGIIHGNT